MGESLLRRIKPWHIFLALVIISIVPRLMLLNAGLFHHDSVRFARTVEYPFESGNFLDLFRDDFMNLRVGYLLYNFATYTFFHFFLGHETAEFSTLFAGALAASLAVGMLFLFLRQLYRSNFVSISSALLFSFFPLFLSFSTYGKEHGAEIFLFLGSLYFFHRGVGEKKLRLFLYSGIFLGYFVLLRESAILYMPLYLLFVVSYMVKFKGYAPSLVISPSWFNRKNLLAFFSPFLILFLISYLWAGVLARILLFVFHPEADFENRSNFMGFFSENFFQAVTDVNVALPLLFIILSVVGLLYMIREKKQFTFFFIAWLLHFFYFANTGSYAPRLLAFPLVPLIFFGAAGLWWIYTSYKTVAILGVVALCVSMLVIAYPVLSERHENFGYKDLFSLYENVSQPGSVIYFYECGMLNYYSERGGCQGLLLVVESCTADWCSYNMEKVERITSLVENGTEVYVSMQGGADENDHQFLSETFDLETVGQVEFEAWRQFSYGIDKTQDTLVRLHPKSTESLS